MTDAETLRYARHLQLPEVGEAGQEKLRAASVLVVGLGGLGSPVALYLAAAGVGRLGLCDGDTVDASNLQRQVIHGTGSVGRPKTASAQERLRELNPLVETCCHDFLLNAENGAALLQNYDIVMDCTDNFPARYMLNALCVQAGKPLVHGSVERTRAQVAVFDAAHGPCYQCLYPRRPGSAPAKATGAVLGVLPGVAGCLQATEAIKLIVGGGRPLAGRLLALDLWPMQFLELAVQKNPDCPVCGFSTFCSNA